MHAPCFCSVLGEGLSWFLHSPWKLGMKKERILKKIIIQQNLTTTTLSHLHTQLLNKRPDVGTIYIIQVLMRIQKADTFNPPVL